MKLVKILLLPVLVIALILKCFKKHPGRKQVHKKLPFEIEFVIDSKNKTLQEIQEERRLMKRILLQGI